MSVSREHRFGRRRGFDRFTIQVVPEEKADRQKGAPITLRTRWFTPDPVIGLLEVANMAHYKGSQAYIAFWRDNWSTVEGSAVVIGPGLAVTALHVLDELMPEIVQGKLNLMLIAPTPDGGRAWRIRNVTRVGGTDLAILSLGLGSRMPRQRKLDCLRLCAVPPKVGDLVMISGFRAAEDVVKADEGVYFPASETSIKHGMRLWRGVGIVQPNSQHHSLCIQVDVRSLGGMSGGAAFNSKGECFGILSSSIDHEDGAGTSRIHLLWPSFITNFPDQLVNPGNTTILLDHVGVDIIGREWLVVEELLSGVKTVRFKTAIEM